MDPIVGKGLGQGREGWKVSFWRSDFSFATADSGEAAVMR
jgi:hypothetical protein